MTPPAAGTTPPADNNASAGFRQHLAGVLVRRALEQAATPPSALRFVCCALEQAPDSPAVTCPAPRSRRRTARLCPARAPGAGIPPRPAQAPDNGLCPARGGDAGPGTAATALARIRRSSDATGNGGIAGHTVA